MGKNSAEIGTGKEEMRGDFQLGFAFMSNG